MPKNVENPNVLVGLETSDDAGIYRLNDEIALVQTVDYFTPIVDDPYMFGAIAASNALSDVYAMGGTPLTVLNIVGFPVSKLDAKILANILRGGADKVKEAGAVIIGGHSIDDSDPKFGMAVTGIVHPDRVWTNAGARSGDALVLTKPIGMGIVTTAIKRGKASPEAAACAQQVMAALNKEAAEAARSFSIHACTDITGFGLLGHAMEMARASKVGMEIFASRIPLLPQTRSLAEAGVMPGGTKRNFDWLKEDVTYDLSLPLAMRYILCDAVTSGGLLFVLPQEEAERLVQNLQERGMKEAAIVGQVTREHPGRIVVHP